MVTVLRGSQASEPATAHLVEGIGVGACNEAAPEAEGVAADGRGGRADRLAPAVEAVCLGEGAGDNHQRRSRAQQVEQSRIQVVVAPVANERHELAASTREAQTAVPCVVEATVPVVPAYA